MAIRISLSRKRRFKNSCSWKEYQFTPEEFFDLEILDEDEKLDIESIPLYLEPIDYLYDLEEQPFEPKDIEEIKIVLCEKCKTKIHSVKYWNEGKNCLIDHLDLYPEHYRNFLVIQTETDNKYVETTHLEKTIGMDTFDVNLNSLLDIDTQESCYSYTHEKYQ
jgi:hypothetical protein